MFLGWVVERVEPPRCGSQVVVAAPGYGEANNVLCGNKAVTFHMLIWQFSPLNINLCFFSNILLLT
jgi:hypothetical protein